MENARIIRSRLMELGYQVFGGVNSPYSWMKIPGAMGSWAYFDQLLEGANIVGTPGAGFGPSGEGYFRFSAFGERENVETAMERMEKIFSHRGHRDHREE